MSLDLQIKPATVTTSTGWNRYERGRRLAGETIGTFGVVLGAGGASVSDQLSGGQVGLVGAALSSGLAVMAMIYALGHICNAHFNPAVTLAFSLTRHFPLKEVPGYIVAQLCGASLAAACLRLLNPAVKSLGATLPANSAGQALLMEGIISFFLMLVIISVATDTRAVGQAAAIAIGVTVIFAILVGGPVSGASMNPARSFGPALLTWSWQDHWVYWLGPVAGTCSGALVYRFLQGQEP